MSIDDEDFTWISQTESRQLELFIGRNKLRRLFAEYLNNQPCHKTILYLYGGGGNGKSLLLKFLQEKCCYHLDVETWSRLKSQDNAVVAETISSVKHGQEVTEVPSVMLDFAQQPRGEEQPQDPFYGLLMLRRKLADTARNLGYKLQFTQYDFACFWYLYKKGKTKEEIKKLFPNEELELTTTILDALTQSVWGSLVRMVAQNVAKHLSESLFLAWKKRGLDEAWFQELTSMGLDTELMHQLPRYFGQDLNAAMEEENAPPRLVLFFDTHEAFWGNQRYLSTEMFFYQDEWLRRLLRALNLESGIVVVVAGRETPRWQEAPKYPIPSQYVNQQPVKELSTKQAITYLHNANIKDEVLTQAMINYARVEDNRIHPMYLGLCADVVLTAAARGIHIHADFVKVPATASKSRELINRLLRYVDVDTQEAVAALSACRAFDQHLYLHLSENLHFHGTAPMFRILCGFSFVWQDKQQRDNWYRIHSLVRRWDYERGNPTTINAHRVLERYYRQKNQLAEAIYHSNRLDWQAGVDEWVDALENALRLSQYELCRQLLEVRHELMIEDDLRLGNVAGAESHYLGRLARYDEALQQCYYAISAYDRSLNQSPQCLPTLNQKVITLARLGQLQFNLCEYEAASQSYHQALHTSNTALSLASDNFYVYKFRGIVLRRLGELQNQLSLHREAVQSYQSAAITYQTASRLHGEELNLLNNVANTNISLADTQMILEEYAVAQNNYQQALAILQQILAIKPEFVYALHNLGKVKRGLAQLHFNLSEWEDGELTYQDALLTFDKALNIAPNYLYAYNDKASTWKSWGDWQLMRSQFDLALHSYQQGILVYDQALQLAPDFVSAHYNQGLALQQLGELYLNLGYEQDALLNWQAAKKQFSRCLEIAPASVDARREKERIQVKMGSCGGS